METLAAMIAAEGEKDRVIGDIIRLLWETTPEDKLPSRREMIRLIREMTGFDLDYCPACRRWRIPEMMTKAQGRRGQYKRYDRPRRCKECYERIEREKGQSYRSLRRERKKAARELLSPTAEK